MNKISFLLLVISSLLIVCSCKKDEGDSGDITLFNGSQSILDNNSIQFHFDDVYRIVQGYVNTGKLVSNDSCADLIDTNNRIVTIDYEDGSCDSHLNVWIRDESITYGELPLSCQ